MQGPSNAARSNEELLQEVVCNPVAVLHGRSPAAAELERRGSGALPAIAEVLRTGWQSEAHVKDVIEAIAEVLRTIAAHNRDAVRALLNDRSLEGSHELIKWSLTAPWRR